MRTIYTSIALGALALCSVPAANAAPAQTPAQTSLAAGTDATTQAVDMSSRHRHWRRWHRHYRYHRWGYGYPGYYQSYAYYPRPYYYRPAPVVSFGFGFGGPRHHWHHW
jgi:hypothetical protein